eukprot:gene9943-2125_t
MGRIFLSILFFWYGYQEIYRILFPSYRNPYLRSTKQDHGATFFHFAEFILSVPFLLGIRTSLSARVLGSVIVLEALAIIFAWWSNVGKGHAFAMREAAAANLTIAGGLFLFATLGAGPISIDEICKKSDLDMPSFISNSRSDKRKNEVVN